MTEEVYFHLKSNDPSDPSETQPPSSGPCGDSSTQSDQPDPPDAQPGGDSVTPSD